MLRTKESLSVQPGNESPAPASKELESNEGGSALRILDSLVDILARSELHWGYGSLKSQ